MAKPSKLDLSGFFDNAALDVDKGQEVTIDVDTTAPGAKKTGVMVRIFGRTDGIPFHRIVELHLPVDHPGAVGQVKRTFRPTRGHGSLRVLAWDKRNGVTGPNQVRSKKLRFKAK